MAKATVVQTQVESKQRLKMVVDNSLLNTQHNKVHINDMGRNLEKRVALFPTLRCSSY